MYPIRYDDVVIIKFKEISSRDASELDSSFQALTGLILSSLTKKNKIWHKRQGVCVVRQCEVKRLKMSSCVLRGVNEFRKLTQNDSLFNGTKDSIITC